MRLEPNKIKRRKAMSFVRLVLKSLMKISFGSLFKPTDINNLSRTFSELYSKLWDFAEHSISHEGFTLPSAMGTGSVQTSHKLLSEIYGTAFSSLSFGGSSGALLTVLTAVIPKLHPHRELILFDDVCHQSTIGGLIFGRWKTVRLAREKHPVLETVTPIKFEAVRDVIEAHGPNKFAAIVLVLPSYDGFRSPSEDIKIYNYAKAHGISVIVDGAWDAMRFRRPKSETPPLSSICDVWITSPHKRGLTPSSLGCILTHNETIAQLWDDALDLGFRSSSVSFVECMIAEHRLEHIASGNWDKSFEAAERAAKELSKRIGDIHAGISIIQPSQVQAETNNPSHLLISTHKITGLDARDWAHILARDFALDVEKATANTLLLICGSPSHLNQIEDILSCLKQALLKAVAQNKVSSHEK